VAVTLYIKEHKIHTLHDAKINSKTIMKPTEWDGFSIEITELFVILS